MKGALTKQFSCIEAGFAVKDEKAPLQRVRNTGETSGKGNLGTDF
jgi:hypothetical protein